MYFFRPRDIISGDFSLLVKRKKHGDVVGGVGDCTGHGIPAALLSVLCHEILMSSIKKHKELSTVISKLNKSIIRIFSRLDKENSVADALDLILFRVIPSESRIEISGIKRPFIHYNSSTNTHDYYSLKGKSIGTPFADDEEIPSMQFTYNDNDYFYFFTDGVTDQFGGPNQKKLMKKGLISCLNNLSQMPPLKREIELDIFLRKWQDKTAQTDDMLFIGISPSNVNLKINSK